MQLADKEPALGARRPQERVAYWRAAGFSSAQLLRMLGRFPRLLCFNMAEPKYAAKLAFLTAPQPAGLGLPLASLESFPQVRRLWLCIEALTKKTLALEGWQERAGGSCSAHARTHATCMNGNSCSLARPSTRPPPTSASSSLPSDPSAACMHSRPAAVCELLAGGPHPAACGSSVGGGPEPRARTAGQVG